MPNNQYEARTQQLQSKDPCSVPGSENMLDHDQTEAENQQAQDRAVELNALLIVDKNLAKL
jgi:hypothetical protein